MRIIRLLKRDLAKEVSEWVEEGIITKEQATKIWHRYGIDEEQIQNKSIGYNVLVTLGIIFIGLAIITLIGANWEEIPRMVRMGGLMILTLTFHGLGWRRYWIGQLNGAIGFFLLGNICYGASIILIAQIYHLGEHMPDGVFWWAIGTLPVGILINSTWLTLFSALLGLLWFILETQMGFYPLLFPVFLLSAGIVLVRGRQNIFLFFTAIGSSGLWLEYTLSQFWREHRNFEIYPEHVVVAAALFLLLYALGHFLNTKENSKAKDYGMLLTLWSLRFGLVFLIVMSFRDPWVYLIRQGWNHLASMVVLVIFLIGLSLVLILKSYRVQPLLYWIGLLAGTVTAVILSEKQDDSIYFQIVCNVSLVGVGIWLIFRGIHSGISHYFFLGIATILTTAFIRYVDLIGNYVGGAILFAFLATILLGAATYWKKQLNRRNEG